MTQTTPITDKSKKSEIYDAYHALLNEVKDHKKSSQKEQSQMAMKAETVGKAVKHTPDTLLKNFTELKLSTGKLLDNVAEQLTEEYNKLLTVREATEIETERLKNSYEINATAETLDALLLAQQRKKEEFELEMEQKQKNLEQWLADKREQWNKEKEQVETQHKEEQQLWKKTKQREEDDYHYQQKVQRQKELDDYALKKTVLERELEEKRTQAEKLLNEREAFLAESEAELNELRAKAAEFPKTLQTAIAEAEKHLKERLEREFRFEADLRQKEIEGNNKLNQQKIAALEAKIKEQDFQLKQLADRSNQATSQVQEIAIKALEGSSITRAYAQHVDQLPKVQKEVHTKE